MSHYNAIVLITPLITHAPTETPAPRSPSADPCHSPLWRQHYAVPDLDTALPALDAVDRLLSPYWDGYDVPRPPGFPQCIGYDFYRVGGRWHGQMEGANIAPAANLPEGLSPYAIVTPDGAWHEREGYFFQPLSEPEASEWVARVRQIIEDNQDAVAVNLDCHV